METEKSFSGKEAEKDFCGRLFFLAAIFPFSNEKACLGVTAKTDFFYRLNGLHCSPFCLFQRCLVLIPLDEGVVSRLNVGYDARLVHNHRAVCRNILCYDAVSADAHIVSDGYAADDLCAGSDIHALADNWSAALFAAAHSV